MDPWRVVDSALPTTPSGPRHVRERINVADIDCDQDLRVANRYLLRSEHASIEVQSPLVAGADDALRELVSCLFELSELAPGDAAFIGLGIGFFFDGRRGGAAPLDGAFAALTTGEDAPVAAVHFYKQSYDHGFLRLVRLLAAVRRQGAAGEAILKRRGVTPLLR